MSVFLNLLCFVGPFQRYSTPMAPCTSFFAPPHQTFAESKRNKPINKDLLVALKETLYGRLGAPQGPVESPWHKQIIPVTIDIYACVKA